MNEISIQPMRLDDIKDVTAVHIRSFEGFFLSFLGPRFLYQLYRSIIEDVNGIAYVAKRDGQILGFAAGSTKTRELYKQMIKRRLFSFAWASVGAFLRKPGILFRLLRAFRMPTEQDAIPNCGTLMSIGVLPDTQGYGIGKKLVKAFLEESSKRCVTCVLLTTDRENNENTNVFYQKIGFRVVRYYATPEGRLINEYSISIRPGEDHLDLSADAALDWPYVPG